MRDRLVVVPIPIQLACRSGGWSLGSVDGAVPALTNDTPLLGPPLQAETAEPRGVSPPQAAAYLLELHSGRRGLADIFR